MDFNDFKNGARKTGKAAVVISSGFVILWACLILADLLTLFWTYSIIDNVMEGYAVSIYIGKTIAALCALVVCVLCGKILLNIIKRNKSWMYMVTIAMVAWFALMFFASSPYTSGLFNPFDGRSRANYERLSDGTIKVFPKSVLYDPDTGAKLMELDQKTAGEYNKQSGSKGPTSFLDRFWPSSNTNKTEVTSRSDEGNLTLWVEKVQVAPDRTVVWLKCKGQDGKEGYLLSEEPSNTYMVDSSGQTYDLMGNTAVYSYGNFFGKGHYVRVDEVYRFALTFWPLQQGASNLKLHLGWFNKPLNLNPALTTAENIPAIPPAPPVPPPEIVNYTQQQTPSPPVSDETPSPPPTQNATWKPPQQSTPPPAVHTEPAVALTPAAIQIGPRWSSGPFVPGYYIHTLDSGWVAPNSNDGPKISVLCLKENQSETVLFLVAMVNEATNLRDLSVTDSSSYLLDNRGRSYRFHQANSVILRKGSANSTDSYEGSANSIYLFEPGYRYILEIAFDPLSYDTGGLVLYRNGYPPIRLTS